MTVAALNALGNVDVPPPTPDVVPVPPTPHPVPPPSPDEPPPEVIEPPLPGGHEPVREPTRPVPQAITLH